MLFFYGALNAGVTYGGQESTFKVGAGGKLHFGNQMTVNGGIFNYQTAGQVSTEVSYPLLVNDGSLVTDAGRSDIAGTMPVRSDFAQILNGDTLRVDGGMKSGNIIVAGTDNRIFGDLLFTADNKFPFSDDAISLQDANTTLTLALNAPLAKNVVLNSSKLILDSDLRFSGTATVKGSGTVDLNKHHLTFGGSDYHLTSTLCFQNPCGIAFNARTSLSGMWTFDGETVHMIGNGNVLDLAKTGTLWVKSGTTLYLTDMKLKGLGNGHGSIIFEDGSAGLRLSNVELELSNNYSVTQGNFYVEGNSQVITKDYKLIFDNKGTLTVDGTSFEYDTLQFSDANNIVPLEQSGNEANLALVNNAVIRNKELDFGQELIRHNSNLLATITAVKFTPVIVNKPNTYLNDDIYITSDRNLVVQASSTITGSGNAIHFARNSNNIVQVADGAQVYFERVVLKDFNDQIMQLGTGSAVIFGEGTVIELSDEQSLSMNWTCTGNVVVHGFGNKLNMDDKRIEVQRGGVLTLRDLFLDKVREENIRCHHARSQVIFDNAQISLDKSYTFSVGSLRFERDVVVTGSLAKFNYSSCEQSVIASNASLILDTGVIFDYMPTAVGSTGASLFSQEQIQTNLISQLATALTRGPALRTGLTPLPDPRDLLVMQDKSSRLVLNGATLRSSHAGMRLTNGTLLVKHKNFLENYNNPRQRKSMAISLGNGVAENDLDIELFPGASLNLTKGLLDYANVD